ncbi:protein kinase family protein [Pseudonocardia yuanmonensis]|uniref:Protein kinase family protein n=1 Tax=Pseudonocardia yuanmonensis TaxID=1095914 RepID=A0ABP8WFC8_9PSEU
MSGQTEEKPVPGPGTGAAAAAAPVAAAPVAGATPEVPGTAIPSPAGPSDAATVRSVQSAPPVTAAPLARGGAVRSTAATGPGTVLGNRYRLVLRVGSDLSAGAEFWRAEDTILQRDVGVTVLRRLPADEADEDPEGTARAGEMIVRALRSGGFEHPGCARLLDVLAAGSPGVPSDVLGAAVTEWVAEHSLTEAVAGGLIKPLRAARMVQQLAAAADEAHGRGLVLGTDHPQRIRVTGDGRAQVAFVLPRPGLTPEDDVRGLGAVLYTLLTSRWPLSGSDAARAGLPSPERDEHGAPVPPSALRPGIPVELDAVCTAALGAHGAGPVVGRVHTAAAVHRMIGEVVLEDDRAALFPPEHDGVGAEPGDVWQAKTRKAAPQDPDRRRKLLIGLGVLGAGVLVVLGYLGVQLGAMFGEPNAPAIVVGDSAAAGAPAPTAPGGPAVSVAVSGVSLEVYDRTGDRDNASDVERAVDGDPATSWATFTYKQQLPALKPGVGLMASFASVEQLSRLTVRSPSAGTVVEIRSAPSVDADLDETQLLTTETLGSGSTTISLADSQPTQHVLVWITKLGGGGDANVSQIDELTFYRAGV